MALGENTIGEVITGEGGTNILTASSLGGYPLWQVLGLSAVLLYGAGWLIGKTRERLKGIL